MRRREFITLLGGAARYGAYDETPHTTAVGDAAWCNSRVAAQEAVETRGVTSAIKIDEVVFGHLTELNGKFKLRATELTFAPDGYIGVHHHVGPGIRYVISGELTFAEGGQETVYNQASIFLKQGTSTYRAE